MEYLLKSISDENAYKGLATAIIIQAIRDFRNNKKEKNKSLEKKRLLNKKEAIRFFDSEWFDFLCFYLEVSDRYIKENLKRDKYDSF